MTTEILNPEVCEDCKTQRTIEGEWVMDVYKCYDQQEYCLNCCGCEDHDAEYWYEPVPNPTQTKTITCTECGDETEEFFYSVVDTRQICPVCYGE